MAPGKRNTKTGCGNHGGLTVFRVWSYRGFIGLPALCRRLPRIWPPGCCKYPFNGAKNEVGVKAKSTVSERRKWARLPLAIPVFVRCPDGSGKELLEFATALNVSAGGMLVAMRRALPSSAQVLLEIPSAPVATLASLPHASRNLRAKTLRTTLAGGYHLLGLKFSLPLIVASRSHNGTRRRKLSSAV